MGQYKVLEQTAIYSNKREDGTIEWHYLSKVAETTTHEVVMVEEIIVYADESRQDIISNSIGTITDATIEKMLRELKRLEFIEARLLGQLQYEKLPFQQQLLVEFLGYDPRSDDHSQDAVSYFQVNWGE